MLWEIDEKVEGTFPEVDQYFITLKTLCMYNSCFGK